MITGEIKNRIDSIWDTFWTGGITNSITILEQMTYLFFMKMLDDAQRTREANANAFGVEVSEPTFKYGSWHNPETDRDVPFNDLRWSVFKNKDPETMYRLVSKDVFVYIKTLNEGKESAYSRFMENATFLIQSPRTLTKIVEGIDHLDMNNRDTMGDVYEYVLSKMAASGNNGQFRTPRHIIRMMVELMQPTLKDTICDPAMGSAGFIVESAKYVQEHYKSELLKRENADHYKNHMLHGFDTDFTMLRIGAMNLMLHGVDNPDIQYRDSLSTDNTDENRYTLCLANPPFTGSLDNEAVVAACHHQDQEDRVAVCESVHPYAANGRSLCFDCPRRGALWQQHCPQSVEERACRQAASASRNLNAKWSVPTLLRGLDRNPHLHQDQRRRNRQSVVLRHESRWLHPRPEAHRVCRERHPRRDCPLQEPGG